MRYNADMRKDKKTQNDLFWASGFDPFERNKKKANNFVNLYPLPAAGAGSADEDKKPSFFRQVYAVVALIPHGKVISYGKIACMLGRPRASREVGRALRFCPNDLPWQRVVMKDGTVTGGAYAEKRKELLKTEGVTFLPDGRVDMALCEWQTP